jgi:hypothetical protein
MKLKKKEGAIRVTHCRRPSRVHRAERVVVAATGARPHCVTVEIVRCVTCVVVMWRVCHVVVVSKWKVCGGAWWSYVR